MDSHHLLHLGGRGHLFTDLPTLNIFSSPIFFCQPKSITHPTFHSSSTLQWEFSGELVAFTSLSWNTWQKQREEGKMGLLIILEGSWLLGPLCMPLSIMAEEACGGGKLFSCREELERYQEGARNKRLSKDSPQWPDFSNQVLPPEVSRPFRKQPHAA